VTQAAPGGRERAKNLLWAAGRPADWGIGLGLDPVPPVLLHSSVTERFTAHAPGLSGVTRRTLRTNLRFLARRVVPGLAPADVPLPRERAKAPYGPAEIEGYLALAAAQPTAARRRRLPPRHLPRRHAEDPLPATPGLHDPRPRPARDPHPAAAPAGLLHPADPHHLTRHRGEDPAETRLPLSRAPPLLHPPHQRAAGSTGPSESADDRACSAA
jgi:hypothetical protein